MLFSPEALSLPEDPDKILSDMQEMGLVKIFIDSMTSAKSLSRDLARLHYVVSVQMFEVNLNDSKKFVIEIETHLSDREKVKKFVVERVGEAKIETFRKI